MSLDPSPVKGLDLGMRLNISYIISQIHCSIILSLLALTLEYPLFHSLEGNRIGDSGATALANALRVNQSLTTLK